MPLTPDITTYRVNVMNNVEESQFRYLRVAKTTHGDHNAIAGVRNSLPLPDAMPGYQ